MIRFVEPGGRMYTTAGTSLANILTNWSVLNGSSTVWSISAGNGRFGGSSFRYTGTDSTSNILSKTLDSQSTWGLNFAIRPTGFGNSHSIFQFQDGSTGQHFLQLTSTGFLQSNCVGGSTYTSSKALSLNNWNYVEYKVTLSSSTSGSFQLKLNGEIISTQTGIKTGGSNTTNVLNICGGIGQNTDFDDIILWDGQTTDAAGNAAISDFFGDVTLSWLLPNGAGATTGFTPLTGSNYAQVNEATPDGDTSYVESGTLNTIDSYTLADLPANITTVKGVMAVLQAKKTDIGGKQLAPLIRTGATNYPANSNINLSNGYLYDNRSWVINPNTGLAWTVSDVNALEVGQKVMS